MEWEFSGKPSYTVLKIRLNPGEWLQAEPGAMMLMRGDIETKTTTGGGIIKGFLRSIASGESMFLNTYIARGPSEIWLAPGAPGDIMYVPLNGNSYIVQNFSYLAHHGDIRFDIEWGGLKSLFAEGELLWLKLSGYGGFWVNAFGSIEVVDLQAGESMTVDNFHFVAMNAGMRYNIRKFGGWKSFILGGEGIVADIYGPGRIYLQTRTIPVLASLIQPYISTK
ncbi:MAG: TIGR00266 family protein [Thermoprotei archaeon]|nr:MAG: TIGR00266 family protein [Thermoprotei archaeon]